MPLNEICQKIPARPVPPGWALDLILFLDDARPGFLRFLHTASALRRQCAYFTLTQLDWDRPQVLADWITRAREGSRIQRDSPLSVIASGLISIPVGDIIHGVFGSAPNGLVGALSRCGQSPLHQVSYTLLHAIFDDPKNRARRTLLRHAPKIDDNLIDVVWRLPKALLRPEVLNQIKTAENIEQYASALNVLRRLHPAITDEDFAVSLSQMSPGTNLTQWLRRWVERARQLTPSLPYAGDDELRPLVSGRELKEVARRYRNCLRRRIGDVALGRALYYEHKNGAIAELKGLSSGLWLLDGIYGPQNKHAAPGTVRAIRLKLEGAGVLVPAALAQGPDEDAFAEVLGLFEFAATPSLSDVGLGQLERT